MLFLNQAHYMHIKYAPGRHSNNKVEFIALWTLLQVEREKKGVERLQVIGDSKLVIDSASKKVNLMNIQSFLMTNFFFAMSTWNLIRKWMNSPRKH